MNIYIMYIYHVALYVVRYGQCYYGRLHKNFPVNKGDTEIQDCNLLHYERLCQIWRDHGEREVLLCNSF